MFADPQSVTITGVNGGVAISLPRVETNGTSSVYQNADETVKLTLSHQPSKDGKRIRTLVRLEYRKIVPDPLTSVNDWDSIIESTTFDRPVYGFSSQEVERHNTGFQAWLSAATVAKLYGKES